MPWLNNIDFPFQSLLVYFIFLACREIKPLTVWCSRRSFLKAEGCTSNALLNKFSCNGKFSTPI